MSGSELFEAGRLQAAIDAQIQKVRNSPTDLGARFFLFELLFFSGEIDRARKQIDMLRYEDPQYQGAVDMYKFALDAETTRRAVLAGSTEPKSLSVAPDHVFKRLEALKRYAAAAQSEGDALVEEANSALPNVKATINGQAHDSLRDGDDLFGTVLEVFGQGGLYCWVPLEQVESISMNPPRFPRDVLLVPASLTLKNGPSGDVLLPATYPGTWTNADDALRLGKATDWVGDEGRPLRGVGGRLFLTGADGTSPLLNWRDVTIE